MQPKRSKAQVLGCFIILLGPACIPSMAGAEPDPPRTQIRMLRELSREFARQHASDGARVDAYLRRSGKPKRKEARDRRPDRPGRAEARTVTLELMRFDEAGVPQYFSTHNLNAARTVSTDRVWSGGGAGLALTGSGIVVGEWDGGGPGTTHQELAGRITIMDGAASLGHSTHVAGTILAAGLIANAKGMAPAATLRAYEWTNDTAEMANEGAGGLLLSNHSYGSVCGWSEDAADSPPWSWYGVASISQVEDYKFGFYTSAARSYDLIANGAPYYLIVKSAGNDRNDAGPNPGDEHWVWNGDAWVTSTIVRHPDGDYDSIGPEGAAKNVLTVGAVDDIPGGYTQPNDVVMTAFSNWGPADDGRIKPDLVANGVSVYSCYNTTDSTYATMSGTSMAAPSVTGSLALLQQHYQATHSASSMLAATLKALAIHTADEAGPANGPDYQFGWGLLNTEKAAQVITADVAMPDRIREQVLPNNGTLALTLSALGGEPLKATIVWNDPAGIPVAAQIDPRHRMLVNDLDLRMTRNSDGQVYYPWTLDVNNPTLAAATGDNITDNVEQVEINSPSGTYILTIGHKGTLSGGAQTVSLIISGAAAIAVTTQTPTPSTTLTRTVTWTVSRTPTQTATRTSTPLGNSTPSTTPTMNMVPTGTATPDCSPTASVAATPQAATIDLGGKAALVYPNPVNRQAKFLLRTEREGAARIVLYNTAGERVGTLDGFLSGGEQTLVWDCGQQAPGLYFARIQLSGAAEAWVKFVIAR